MSTILEKLVGAKALIESAIAEELERTAPPPPTKEPTDCEHKNREEITGAGSGGSRMACVDCGEKWEVDDAS